MYMYIRIYIRKNLLHVQGKADEIRKQKQEEITKERVQFKKNKKNLVQEKADEIRRQKQEEITKEREKARAIEQQLKDTQRALKR